MAGRSSAFFAPLRVFLIAFDVDQRDRIERDLRRKGFLDIVALPNVATALYLLDMLGCDLMIMEIGADCLRLLQLLSIDRHAQTFVIAMISDSPIPDIRPEAAPRIDRVIAWPVDPAELLEAVAAFRASRLPEGLSWRSETLFGSGAAPA